jgi:hypothetical protein
MIETQTETLAPVQSAPPADDPMAMVNAMASTTKPTKAKGGKPEFHDPNLAPLIEQYRKQKAAMDTAKALMEAAKGQITQAVKPYRLQQCVAATARLARWAGCGSLPPRPRLKRPASSTPTAAITTSRSMTTRSAAPPTPACGCRHGSGCQRRMTTMIDLTAEDEKTLNWLDYARLKQILEDHGFQVHHSESEDDLRTAVRVNIEDRTIDMDVLYADYG